MRFLQGLLTEGSAFACRFPIRVWVIVLSLCCRLTAQVNTGQGLDHRPTGLREGCTDGDPLDQRKVPKPLSQHAPGIKSQISWSEISVTLGSARAKFHCRLFYQEQDKQRQFSPFGQIHRRRMASDSPI